MKNTYDMMIFDSDFDFDFESGQHSITNTNPSKKAKSTDDPKSIEARRERNRLHAKISRQRKVDERESLLTTISKHKQREIQALDTIECQRHAIFALKDQVARLQAHITKLERQNKELTEALELQQVQNDTPVEPQNQQEIVENPGQYPDSLFRSKRINMVNSSNNPVVKSTY